MSDVLERLQRLYAGHDLVMKGANEIRTLLAENENLKAEVAENAEAIRTVLCGFDEGVFVRSVAGDTDSGWALKLFPFVRALGVLADRYQRQAEGGGDA